MLSIASQAKFFLTDCVHGLKVFRSVMPSSRGFWVYRPVRVSIKNKMTWFSTDGTALIVGTAVQNNVAGGWRVVRLLFFSKYKDIDVPLDFLDLVDVLGSMSARLGEYFRYILYILPKHLCSGNVDIPLQPSSSSQCKFRYYHLEQDIDFEQPDNLPTMTRIKRLDWVGYCKFIIYSVILFWLMWTSQ